MIEFLGGNFMKKRKLITVPATLAALTTGVGFALFEEVMSSNPLVYPKVSKYAIKMFEKKNAETNGPKPEFDKNKKVEENGKWFNSVTPEDIFMTNSTGLKLHGCLLLADEPSKVFVVCCHGYTSSGKGDYATKAKFWHDMGYNVFLVDHRCHGKSEGKWIGFGYHESKDTIEWLNFLKARFGDDIEFVLHGISMGSATVMMMSGDVNLPDNVKCTVADCGYTSCRDELKYGLNNLAHLPDFPFLYLADFFNKSISGYHFKDASPIDRVKTSKVPILFIHGGNDIFVPTYMVNELYNSCPREDKELFIVEGAGHTESHWVDTLGYEKRATEFAEKYV